MKKLIGIVIALTCVIAMASAISAFTGAVEYKEVTATGATSTAGTTFQGDVLVCAWDTSGTFSGTIKVQMYQTLGPTGSKALWIDTGDVLLINTCKVLTVPENGVKLRGYATVSAGTVKIRISQEYPTKVNNVGR